MKKGSRLVGPVVKKKSLMQLNSVAGAFFTHGSGMEKKNRDPGSGMNFQIIFQRAKRQFLGQKILKFFDADPRSGIRKLFGPG
jgi:hypothetical protein